MTTIGYVNAINGKFYARSDDGSVRELKLGDPVFQDDFVYGNNLNSANSIISISMDAQTDPVEISSNDGYLFGTNTDKIETELPDTNTEESLVAVLSKYGDMEETSAGEDKQPKESESVSIFADRTGNIVDINAGLRAVVSSSYQLNHQDNEDKFIEQKDNRIDSNGSTISVRPDITTQITPPTTPTPPASPTPLVSNITVTIDGNTLVYEGVSAKYTLTLSRPVTSDIDIEITTSNITTQNTDITPTIQIITIPAGSSSVTFSIDNIDDIYDEVNEDYAVKITSVITEPTVNATVVNDHVETTILDEGTPLPPSGNDQPENPTPPVAQERETVYVQLINSDSVAEGTDLVHGIQLIDVDGNPVLLQDGQNVTVTLTYTDDSTEGASDYTAQTTVTIVGTAGGNSTAVITNPTIDDFYAEGIEQYTIAINTVSDDNNTFEAIANQGDTIIGTIIDNPSETPDNPGTPPPENGGYDPVDDTVYVQLIRDDSVSEGATLVHGIQLVDSTGAAVMLEDGQNVTVTLTYTGTSSNPATQGIDYTAQTAVTIAGSTGGNNTATITNSSIDDFFAEGIESYTISVNTISDDNSTFEVIVDEGSTVTGSITDDQGTPNTPPDGPEADHELVIIKLVALNSDGSPILDNNGKYTFANEVFEGNDAKYMALAFEPNETVFSPSTQLSQQVGNVDITFSDLTAQGTLSQMFKDGTQDYDNNPQTVSLGTIISTATFDDYVSDNAEQYTISITNGTYTPNNGGYENIIIDTSPVTTTITDNDSETPPTTPPEESGGYDPVDDTVYVQLITDDSVGEGADLVHGIKLVDSTGADVMLEAGQNVTVQLTYTGTSANPTEGASDFTAQTSVTIVGAIGGNNTAVITNPTLDDFYAEGVEEYTVSIASQSDISDDNNTFETIQDEGSTVTGTINDGSNDDVPNEPVDTIYVQLDTDASVIEAEGATLTHNFHLVDKDGNAVNLANGETISLNLVYTNDSTVSADYSTKSTAVTITGDGGSDYGFTNTVTEDTIDEGTESYDVAISAITADSGYFENVQIADIANGASATVNSAHGEIVEEIDLVDDHEEVVEGAAAITNITESMNLLDNDEIGVNGQITEFTYTDEGGVSQTASAGATVDTEFGTVTINTDGTWAFTPDPTENQGTTIDTMTYTVVDDDGKTGTADFTVEVTDTDPSVTAPNSTLDEENLPDGSNPIPANLTVVQDLDITKDQDDITDVSFDATTITGLNALNLQSGGANITYILSNSNHTITANNGTNDVFIIELGNTADASGATQNYTFELLDIIDHPNANAQNTVVFPFSFNLSDIDSTVSGNSFHVTIIDDIPTANPEATLTVGEGNIALSGMVALMVNDVEGADGATLSSFTYVNESGNTVSGTLGSTMNSQYGTLTVNTDGSWTYTSDASESNESGTDAGDTNDFVTDSFTYLITDADGDTSTAIQSINVTDGADPTIAPADLTISEASLGTGVNLLPFTSTDNALNIAKGSDDIADTKFTSTQANLEALNLTSDGNALSYSLDVSGHVLTAIRAGDNAEVFQITITNPNSVNAKYDFKLSLPLDHVDNGLNGDNSVNDIMSLPFDVYTYDTDNKNGVDGDDDASGTFNVVIHDSTPSATNQDLITDEDTDKTIRLSQDDFNGNITITALDGNPQSIATGASADIYDINGDDIIGTLLNNGDGTVTFTPSPDYSNYNANPTFDYSITDVDGDTASTTITITVNPIADAPTDEPNKTVYTVEDAAVDNVTGNQREGSNDTPLDLVLPVRKDQIDQNDATTTATGDNPERLGTLDFSFATSADFGTATFVYDTDGNGSLDGTLQTFSKNDTFSIDITDVADYHPTGTTGTYSLTQAQYQSLAIIHEEDNDTNIKIKIKTQSHEVDDSGASLGIVSSVVTQNITLDIQAVTDDVTLAWDNASRGSISTTTNTDDTYTFTTINEGNAGIVIDLPTLLTVTSGYGSDASGDLDGSEERSYTLSGIPEGSVITLNGNSVAVAAGQTSATIALNDNALNDPSFTLTLPEQYGGTITDATITLHVTDYDSDDNVASVEKTAEVYFNINVTPIADTVTLQVAQATGDEDAGRTFGNTANDGTASLINDEANAIELDILVTSDDTDGSETYTVTINDIPDGGALYYSDANGTILVSDTGILSGSHSTLTTGDDGTTWHATIPEFDNNGILTFVPPHNSDVDYQFNIVAFSNDNGVDTSVTQTLQISVNVDDVADIPVNDDLATTTVDDDASDTNSFTLTQAEDSGAINLKTVLSTPAFLNSYDADGSETLTMKVTGLESGFDIQGATFLGGSGTDRVWFVDLGDLQGDLVSLTSPEHFAGEIDFSIQLVTTEDAGDSATHPIKDVSVMITPVAEASVNTSDSQNEDQSLVLDFGLNKPDTGDASVGIENLASFGIDMSTVDPSVTLTGSVSGVLSGAGYVALDVSGGVLETVTATLPEDSNIAGGYDFNIQYTIDDVATDALGNTYTDTKTVTDVLYTVAVTAVTDDIDLTIDTANVNVTNNTTFTKALNVAGLVSDGTLADTDSSENFTRVTVSAVPEGVTVVGGVYAGDTNDGQYSGFWYVDIADQAIDGDDAQYNLEFDVDGAPVDGTYAITVTAYNEDVDGGEQSDSETFNLVIADDGSNWNGQTPGVPATINSFSQDIDTDGVADHANASMTDADAYDGSILREDVQFALGSVVDVNTTDSSDFSITIKNLPAGVDITGMTLNANDFYTLSGSGDATSIAAALNTILITPIANANTDAGSIAASDLAFDIELTTYATGGEANTSIINFTGSVLPVTDAMNLTLVDNTAVNEDTQKIFTLTLDNDADGANTVIVDATVYLQMTENFGDSNDGSDGTAGTLSYSGSVITTQAVSGVSGIADGNYYVITGVAYNDNLVFTYDSASDRDGTVDVDVFVKNIESETWSPYNTSEMTSTQTLSFDVNSVRDGFTFDTSAGSTGVEDNMTQIQVTVSNPDSSEELLSVSLDKIPDGFLVFYGADAGSAVQAQNIGVNGTMTMQMTYGVDEVVNYNLWNIPLSGGVIPPYIGIIPPENWSGTIPDVVFNATDTVGAVATSPFDIVITPDVDTLTLNATQTFGNEGEDIALKLNANVVDLDGSETVTLSLSGFGDANATFKANGVAINSSYDGVTDTYTITDIAAADINAMSFVHTAMSETTISATAYMVESDNSTSADVTGSFNVTINTTTASSGDDTLIYEGAALDGLGGTDTVVLGGAALNFSDLSNIEILDLVSGNNAVTPPNLTFSDVISMTDSNNDLKILGDSGDTVTLATADGWSLTGSVNEAGVDFNVYANSNDATVELKIQDQVNDSIA